MDLSIDKVNEILDKLKGIRIKEATLLKKRLEKERQKLISAKSKPVISKEKVQLSANKKRSLLMKRNWRFWKLATDRTGIKVSEVRREWKKRKQGFDSKIPDAIWQNLSG